MAGGSSVCARPAAGRRPGIVAVPAKGGIGAVRAWPGRSRPGTDGPAWSSLPGSPASARQRVFQSRKTKARPVPASGPGGRGCVPDVPAPVRTAGSSAAAPVDQEGGHGERHEDAPWAVPAMAGAVPEAAALPRPGAWNVSFPVARLRRPHRMTDTPCPGRAGGRRPARTSGPSLSCRSPRIRACRSSGRSSRRRLAGRGPVRSGAPCRPCRASPKPASCRWSRTSRTASMSWVKPGSGLFRGAGSGAFHSLSTSRRPSGQAEAARPQGRGRTAGFLRARTGRPQGAARPGVRRRAPTCPPVCAGRGEGRSRSRRASA